ncbi:uncharacterized protein LOC143911495 [Arctopsyche grandis]|uniref:uncharacterized protein LOC143911495 n=1 Tax=Arctopsyche grandis TaxID=121162 RepID=UPI00406D6E38
MDYNKPPPYNPDSQPVPPQQYPPQQYPPQYPQQYPQQYPPVQSQPVHISMAPPTQHTIIVQPGRIVTGNCPGCRQGNLSMNFTCCGVLCAIFFFPIGILCCIFMAQKRCNNCGGHF